MAADPSDEYLDHVRRPRNVGVLDEPDGESTVRDDTCGDLLRLTLRVRDARVEEARFRAFGCGATVASSSMLTEMLRGLSVEEAGSIVAEDVARSLPGLPRSRRHSARLAGRALAEALADYKRRKESTGWPSEM